MGWTGYSLEGAAVTLALPLVPVHDVSPPLALCSIIVLPTFRYSSLSRSPFPLSPRLQLMFYMLWLFSSFFIKVCRLACFALTFVSAAAMSAGSSCSCRQRVCFHRSRRARSSPRYQCPLDAHTLLAGVLQQAREAGSGRHGHGHGRGCPVCCLRRCSRGRSGCEQAGEARVTALQHSLARALSPEGALILLSWAHCASSLRPLRPAASACRSAFRLMLLFRRRCKELQAEAGKGICSAVVVRTAYQCTCAALLPWSPLLCARASAPGVPSSSSRVAPVLCRC